MQILNRFSKLSLGAALLALSSILSRALGVYRDFIFAKIFGVGGETSSFALDAYFAAFRIPDVIYTLVVFGAMSAAFIPVYKQFKQRNEADLFASQVLHFLLLFLFIFTVLAFAFTSQLVQIYTPGFSAEVQLATVQLTRIMLVSPLFFGLSAVLQGVQNSHHRFFGIALAPVLYNLSIVVSALVAGETYGVYALAWGVSLGAFLHFLIQIPGVFALKFRYQWSWSFSGKAFKKFIRLTVPRLFGISVAQASLIIDTLIATTLSFGSVSVFNYALNLQSLPHGVFAVSLAVAAFAYLSQYHNDSDAHAFLKTLRETTAKILFWVMPAIVGIFLTKDLIVSLLLEGGAFSSEAAVLTTKTLGLFIWASVGMSLVPLYARAFYARHITSIPVWIAFFAFVVNPAVSLSLIHFFDYGVEALALATVVSQSLNALLLLLFLGRELKESILDLLPLRSLLLITLNTGLLSFLVLGLRTFSYSGLIVEIITVTLIPGAIYLGLAQLTRTKLLSR